MTFSLPDQSARLERHQRSRPLSSLFRTDTLAPTERFEAWRESMSVFLDASLGVTVDADAFTGEIESYLLDDIMLTRAVTTRQKYDRAETKIAQDSLDHYMIQVFVGGHTEMKVGRRAVRSEADHPIAFDLGDVMDSFNSDFDILCAVVPRARLAPLLLRPDSMQGLIPDRDSGAGRLLADFLRSLYLVAPSLTPLETKTSARALLELIASAFNGVEAAAAAGRAREYALLLRAQQFIRDNLASPDLSPEAIGLGVGLSRTGLYQLFEPLGGVAEYVRELRLRKCLAEIVSARHAHRHVSDIAYGWGFASPAHFARTFKQRFGRTPSEARISAGPLVARDRVELDPRVGDRRYEEWIAGMA
jgi:AraC-like DNA-binding protein